VSKTTAGNLDEGRNRLEKRKTATEEKRKWVRTSIDQKCSASKKVKKGGLKLEIGRITYRGHNRRRREFRELGGEKY